MVKIGIVGEYCLRSAGLQRTAFLDFTEISFWNEVKLEKQSESPDLRQAEHFPTYCDLDQTTLCVLTLEESGFQHPLSL